VSSILESGELGLGDDIFKFVGVSWDFYFFEGCFERLSWGCLLALSLILFLHDLQILMYKFFDFNEQINHNNP
jgi:hypothetical protein